MNYGHELRLSMLSGRRKKNDAQEMNRGGNRVITFNNRVHWGRYEREPTIKNINLYEG